MPDNLNIKGLQETEPRGRNKPRGKRNKPFAIEARLIYPKDAHKNSIYRNLNLSKWWVWGRYETAASRDQAYTAMVKRETHNEIPRWGRWEYRKKDD